MRLTEVLKAAEAECGGFKDVRVAVTGRKLRNRLALSSLSEPEATEMAVAHVLPEGHPYRVVVSAGGETFLLYYLDDDGRIESIQSGNK